LSRSIVQGSGDLIVLLEGFEFSILDITDEVVRGVVATFSVDSLFFGLPFTPQLSLLVLSCPANTFRLEVELLRRLESKYVVDLIEGLGLGTVYPLSEFNVAEAGNRGGGILSCFGG
jgi:hypothetical protein